MKGLLGPRPDTSEAVASSAPSGVFDPGAHCVIIPQAPFLFALPNYPKNKTPGRDRRFYLLT